MANLTPDTFKPILGKLIAAPELFTPEHLQEALEHILTPDAVLPSQIGAFLTAMTIHQIERRSDALAAAAVTLRGRSLETVIEGWEEDYVVDIVGTGGDGHNTFNVSTTAAIVAAGAGARVCKHGARASTSASGSADLLQSLGCPFNPPSAPARIPRIPFSFFLATHFHPALAVVAPHRKALPIRTMFNILGPLLNPARPKGMILGVAHPSLGRVFADTLRLTRDASSLKHALVVCGDEGLDEISCAGPTTVWEVKEDGTITESTLHPERDFGVPLHPLIEVAGGTPAQNAESFELLLRSGEAIPERLHAVRDFVLINAAALLVVAGVAPDYKAGVKMALESMTSGNAWKALETFIEAGKA